MGESHQNPVFPQIAIMQQELEDWNRKVVASKSEFEAVQQGLDSQKEEIKKVQEQKETTEAAARKAQEELTKIQRDISDVEQALENKKTELRSVTVELDSTKKKSSIASSRRNILSAFGLALCFTLAIGIVTRSDRVKRIEERDNALKKLSVVEEYTGPVLLKIDRIYNNNGDLKKEDMRHLVVEVTVHLLEDGMKFPTIFIDIYKPDGTLSYTEGYSSNGHTIPITPDMFNLSDTRWTVKSGWGHEDESTFEAGTYRVDVVYNDTIVCSRRVTIEP